MKNPTHCPVCSHVPPVSTVAVESELFLCQYCASSSIFTPELQLRELTKEDFLRLEPDAIYDMLCKQRDVLEKWFKKLNYQEEEKGVYRCPVCKRTMLDGKHGAQHGHFTVCSFCAGISVFKHVRGNLKLTEAVKEDYDGIDPVRFEAIVAKQQQVYNRLKPKPATDEKDV